MEETPDNQQQVEQPQDHQPRLDVNQIRGRLEAAVAFKKTEAYLDFVENLDAVIDSADDRIEEIPESYHQEKIREQSIGERRQARLSKTFFDDYIEELDRKLNELLAEQELEPEQTNNPNTK